MLEDGRGDERRDVYQVAPLHECPETWLSDKDVLEAQARFGQEPILQEDVDDLPWARSLWRTPIATPRLLCQVVPDRARRRG